MDRKTFVREAELLTALTDRQAEAFYRRHVGGEGRQAAADAMETSASNVDNLERAARQHIMRAENLRSLTDAVGYEHETPPAIGTCAECDDPTDSLAPDQDDDRPIEERRMLCPDCAQGGS